MTGRLRLRNVIPAEAGIQAGPRIDIVRDDAKAP
jgi:hypothetical protein